MNRSYVDDLLRTGNSKLKKLCQITHQKFETTPDEYVSFMYAGCELRKLADDSCTLDKLFHLKMIKILNGDDAWSTFASGRMMLAGIADSMSEV